MHLMNILTTTARAHNRHILPRLNLKRHAAEYVFFLRRVAEPHVSELDDGRTDGRRQRV